MGNANTLSRMICLHAIAASLSLHVLARQQTAGNMNARPTPQAPNKSYPKNRIEVLTREWTRTRVVFYERGVSRNNFSQIGDQEVFLRPPALNLDVNHAT
jgi:hypothetical protein